MWPSLLVKDGILEGNCLVSANISFHITNSSNIFSGDKLRISEAGVPQGYVIQCIVNTLDFDVITTKD